jgi:HK97 family phage prohead protease/HK97 family phage major capsid protein
MRYAVKSAPPPGGAPNEFVMSDGSIDRMGDVIDPKGWILDHFKNHPIALFNHDSDQIVGSWADVRIEGGRLIGTFKPLEPGTTALADGVRKMVEQQVLRAVSVGFRPVEKKPLNDAASEHWGPFRFMKQDLLECSLVAVPANPNALSTAKSLGISSEIVAQVFRKPAGEDRRPPVTGKSAKHLAPQGTKMKPLSERIEHAQIEYNTNQDRLQELAEMDTLDDAGQAEVDERSLNRDTISKQIETWKKLEKSIAAQRTPPQDVQAPAVIRATPHAMRKLEPRDHIYRALTTHFIAKMQQKTIEDVLRERYPGDEGTGAVLRTATGPAITTQATWAAELVGTAIADFLGQLPITTIYPRLSAKGIKFTFGRNGVIKVPGRSATPTINGSFVGEGQPIPVRKLGLTAITLTPKKMAVISEFTREMALHSTPAIEGVIRQAINDDTAVAIDTVLIDATVADLIRPAGLRAGVGGLTPSVATAAFDKMIADIKALIAPIVAARGGRDLVLLMNTAQSLSLSWVVTPNGEFVFADVNDGTLRNLTVITSTTVPAGMLIMVDAAEFASVTGDAPEFDVSDVATIHEEDTAPLPIVGGTVQPPAIGSVAAPVRSLWQTASIGVRMMVDMNWTMRRANMVSWMTGVTW